MKKYSLIFFLYVNFSLSAQLQTRCELNLGIISAAKYSSGSIQQFHANNICDGRSINVFIRKEVFDFLSFKLGYSYSVYGFAYELNNKSEIYINQAYAVHSLPFCSDVDVKINKKISGFLSNGLIMCADTYNSVDGSGTTSYKDLNLNALIQLQWEYSRHSRFFVYYKTGFGCRINLMKNLYFEPGLNYFFRFHPVRDYNISVTYFDGKTETYHFKDEGNYLSINFGISYSLHKKKTPNDIIRS